MTAPRAKVVIQVQDEPCEVTVYQQSESAWIAVGDVMGERLEVKGRTDAHAVGLWREVAKFKRD